VVERTSRSALRALAHALCFFLRGESNMTRKVHVDYTQMEHHDETPDPTDTGDPSSPLGAF